MHQNGNGVSDYGGERPTPIRDILRDMQATLNKMDNRATRIDTVLFGDEQAKIPGLVDKVDKHGKYISLDKKMKIFGTGLAASTGTGWAFWDIVKHWFK